MINKLSLEEESILDSEFTYHDKKAGIIGGYCEDGFPLYYANDEIAAMLGYDSVDEFVKAIDGRVINMLSDAQTATVPCKKPKFSERNCKCVLKI